MNKVKRFTRAQRRAKARSEAYEARKRELSRAGVKAYSDGHAAGFTAGRDSVIPVKVVDRSLPQRIWIGPKEHVFRVFVPAQGRPDYLDREPSEVFRFGGEIELRADVEAVKVEGVIIEWPRWTVGRIVPVMR